MGLNMSLKWVNYIFGFDRQSKTWQFTILFDVNFTDIKKLVN